MISDFFVYVIVVRCSSKIITIIIQNAFVFYETIVFCFFPPIEFI